jgi:hypothetical protein
LADEALPTARRKRLPRFRLPPFRLRSPQDGEILRLAVPAFGALVAEPLFLLADSAIVGRLGTVPLGGLGIASQALSTLVGISRTERRPRWPGSSAPGTATRPSARA